MSDANVGVRIAVLPAEVREAIADAHAVAAKNIATRAESGDLSEAIIDDYLADYAAPRILAALAALAEAQRDKERLADVIRWALGERDEFPMWPDSVEIKGNPKFWWRTELRRRFNAAMQEASR